jgi:hypothetical protein
MIRRNFFRTIFGAVAAVAVAPLIPIATMKVTQEMFHNI